LDLSINEENEENNKAKIVKVIKSSIFQPPEGLA
jgi:hypothetical protein